MKISILTNNRHQSMLVLSEASMQEQMNVQETKAQMNNMRDC